MKEIFLFFFFVVSNSGLIFKDVTLTVSLTGLERRLQHTRKLLLLFPFFSPQTCLSPVSILGVTAGSPIKAGVTGVGGAGLVGHFPGSAATHSRGRHRH